MSDEIDNLLDEILVNAYNEDEQLTSFELAFQDRARFPFRARVVGTTVDVTKVSYEGDDRRGLTAHCRREGERHQVSLADLSPVLVTHETSLLLRAYRRWLGLPETAEVVSPAPQKRDRAATARWSYRTVATRAVDIARPLALKPEGLWDPTEQYWGEEGTDIDPLYQALIAAGPRPEFEMEQVIPGVGPEDWDLDPVADAAELHRFGHAREASRILQGLIAEDERCIDAWVHLGNIAFDAKGPKAAIELYDTGVAIGEQSLPHGFSGVLPRGFVDNRPFHRALHGLGLCAWRQRHWEDAEVIFTNLLWIDGAQTWDALECFCAVHARERWRKS